MRIKIDPDEIEIHHLDDNLIRLSYRGWWIRHPAIGTASDLRDLRFPEETEIYRSLLRQNGATWLRLEIAGMSNHQRLIFGAAVKRWEATHTD